MFVFKQDSTMSDVE